MRIERFGLEHHFGRRLIAPEIGRRQLLQVVSHADHHGLARLAHRVERLAYILMYALRAAMSCAPAAAANGTQGPVDDPDGLSRQGKFTNL
jgi:hypothetical protein